MSYKKFRHHNRRKHAAFSLVELMVVIVIIGLLAGAVTLSVRAYMDKARVNRAKQDIGTIMSALESYYAEYSRYPTSDEGLASLSSPSDKWPTPLLPAEPVDPWGNAYGYNSPGPGGQPYEIICYGYNGRPGGDGIEADITSEDVRTNTK